MESANRLLIGSFAIAAFGWIVQPLTILNTVVFVSVSAVLAAPWTLLLILSLRRHGKRGLWVLAGAPLVAFWPAAFGLLIWSCHHGYECM